MPKKSNASKQKHIEILKSRVKPSLKALTDEEYANFAKSLHGKGVHLLRTGGRLDGEWDEKKAIDGGWQKKPASWTVLEAHLKSSKPSEQRDFGLIPASMDLVIVDVDSGGPSAAAAIMQAIDAKPVFAYCSSLREDGPRFHIAYPAGEGGWKNKAIYHPETGARCGELRCGNGYIHMKRTHGAMAFDRAAAAKGRAPADLTPLLKGDKDAAAVAIDFENGNRNNSLNAAVFKAGLKGDKDAAKAAVAKGRNKGLGEDEIQDVVKRAWRDGVAKAKPKKETKRAKRAKTLQEKAESGIFKHYLEAQLPAAIEGAEGILMLFYRLGNRKDAWTPKPDEARFAELQAVERAKAEGKEPPEIESETEWANRMEDALTADGQEGRKARWKYLREMLTTAEKGNSDGLADALRTLGVEVRMNERRDKIEYRMDKGSMFGWRPLHDQHEAGLREFLRDNFRTRPSNPKSKRKTYPFPTRVKTAWEDTLNALIETKLADDFRDWLEALPPWDGVERLPTLLHNMYGCAEDDQFAAWAAHYMFCGAAWRTFEPGTSLHEIPILIGAQGIGKSAFPRCALPKEGRNIWFSDGLNLAGSPKEQVEAISGRVICESAELTGMRKVDLAKLKRFITANNDGDIRSAYDRRPKDRPRRMVLIGTSDRLDCIPADKAGYRRFVPVVLPTGCHVEAWMDEWREQLWAEGVAKYAEGMRANLPKELMSDQLGEVHNFIAIDQKLMDRLNHLIFETGELGDRPAPFSLISDAVNRREVAEDEREDEYGDTEKRATGAEIKPQYRYGDDLITAALNRLGWRKFSGRRRVNGNKVKTTLWTPPDCDEPEGLEASNI